MPQKRKGDRAMAYRYPTAKAVAAGRPEYPGYYLVVTLGADGGRSQKKYPFDSPELEEIARHDAELDAETTNEEATLADGMTVEEALARYRDHKVKQGRRPRSIETTLGRLENLFPAE